MLKRNHRDSKMSCGLGSRIRLSMGSFVLYVLLLTACASPSFAVVVPGPTTDAAATGVTIWTKLQDIIDSIAEYEGFIEIATAWAKFHQTWAEGMGIYKDREIASAKTFIFGTMLQSHIKTLLAQQKIDAMASNTLLEQQLKNRMNQTNPLPSDQFLCNVLVARQAAPVMVEFSRMVSNIIRKGLDSTYRGPADNGSGPQFYSDIQRLRCGEIENNDLKVQHPIDGPREECSAEVSLADHTTADMDISFDTLSRDRIYQIPPVELVDHTINGRSVQVLTFVPERDNEIDAEPQRRWIKASMYCYTLAGPRPTPPYGENMNSESGKRKRAQFDFCRAKQNNLIKQCTDRLAMLTRPNCNMEEMLPFCEVAEDACAAAREAKIDLGPAYNDCRHGLSLYELENISNEMCGSSRRFQTEGFAGASEQDKIRILATCSHLKGAWQDRLDEEDRAFAKASLGLRDIQDCFASIKD